MNCIINIRYYVLAFSIGTRFFFFLVVGIAYLTKSKFVGRHITERLGNTATLILILNGIVCYGVIDECLKLHYFHRPSNASTIMFVGQCVCLKSMPHCSL